MILGMDPGPTTCGAVLYDTNSKRVISSRKALTIDGAMRMIDFSSADLVAIERVQSYGIAGSSLLRTAEVGGMLHYCARSEGLDVVWLYRREVLRGLDVTGKGNRDALVRHRLIEIHGGDRASAVGLKASPGPLFGVSSHAWAALAVAVVAGLEDDSP
tara:strand:+ start:2703 stop:3176 length:474 start_codon:yes stop_codon:yes gene_type:complete